MHTSKSAHSKKHLSARRPTPGALRMLRATRLVNVGAIARASRVVYKAKPVARKTGRRVRPVRRVHLVRWLTRCDRCARSGGRGICPAVALRHRASRADPAAAAAVEPCPGPWSFWVAAALLIAWLAALAIRARSGALTLDVRLATPRPQHYVQSLCQFGVYAYWGWFWPPVYDFAPLLLGQLIFAYVFDMLLAWSRARALPASASDRFPSSSAPTCFSGSRTTGSSCNSC